jgi:hypothetical protein
MSKVEPSYTSKGLRFEGEIETNELFLYKGDTLVANRGYQEDGWIHFDDPDGVSHPDLYALRPEEFITGMGFNVYDDEVLGDPLISLSEVILVGGTVSLEAYISGDRVVEFSGCHPNLFLRTMKQWFPESMTLCDDRSDANMSNTDCFISFKYVVPFVTSIDHHIAQFRSEVLSLIERTKLQLTGKSWSNVWHTEERLFSVELMEPLLRAMGFDAVRNTHGSSEFGKDILCRDFDRFGCERWLGIQLKAGDITGEVNSIVDVIVGQINDAFAMPFDDGTSRSKKHISLFYVICSGRITENARTKIWSKIPPSLVGSVTFLDRQDLQGLIEKYMNPR